MWCGGAWGEREKRGGGGVSGSIRVRAIDVNGKQLDVNLAM
jgi:hypothetical protein